MMGGVFGNNLSACGLITLDAHHDLRDGETNGSPVRSVRRRSSASILLNASWSSRKSLVTERTERNFASASGFKGLNGCRERLPLRTVNGVPIQLRPFTYRRASPGAPGGAIESGNCGADLKRLSKICPWPGGTSGVALTCYKPAL